MINVVKYNEMNKTKVFGLVIETISRNRLFTIVYRYYFPPDFCFIGCPPEDV